MYRVDVFPKGNPVQSHVPGQATTDDLGSFFPGVDVVYSFRSGPGSRLQNINIPKFENMKPAQRLKSLNQFYRDFSESASASSTRAAEEGEMRFSQTDNGHQFLSMKVRTRSTITGSASGRPFIVSCGYPASTADGFYPGAAGVAKDAKALYNQRIGDINVSQLFSGSQDFAPQSLKNYLFSKVRLHKPAMDIGETLVEFIRQNPVRMIGDLLTSWSRLSAAFKHKEITSDMLKNMSFYDQFTLQHTVKGRVKKSANADDLDFLKRVAKEYGRENLWYQFGVLPLFSDVVKTIQNLSLIHSRVYGSSSHVRKRSHLQNRTYVLSSQRIRSGLPAGSRPDLQLNPVFGTADLTVVQNWDTVLSGRVGTLARPTAQADSFIERADTLMYNLGLQEPALSWNLTSFSWLLDWWLHLNTSITNAYAFGLGGTSVDYAYATTYVRTLASQQYPGRTPYTSGGITYILPPGRLSTFFDVRFRERATPFGFGGDLSSLTSGQMNILSALGLAKARL